MDVIVGCCGQGGLSVSDYRSKFRAMEVQYTFYRLPRSGTPSKWVESFGRDFLFTMKAYQGLTHPFTSPTWHRYRHPEGDPERYGGLKPTEENYTLWERVLGISRKLGSRFIVVQLPPSFTKNAENLGNLVAFFGSVERPVRVGVELRSPSWFEYPEEISSVFYKLDLVDVFDPFRREPLLFTDVAYLRLHGRGKSYTYDYSDSELELLRKRVEGLRSNMCYVFFNNTAMAKNAQRFQQLISS
ncbi:MAG: DUF72 domain-containing protein [Thermoprotei archaeon]